MKQRVIIFGASGMLGHKLAQIFSQHFETHGTVRGSVLEYSEIPVFDSVRLIGGIDCTDDQLLGEVVRALRPTVVVNAVGVVKQSAALADEDLTVKINSELPHKLAGLAQSVGARFLGISTDCVFSGADGRYSEEAVPDAKDLYATTKLAGEVTEGDALTIRTSIIGRELAGAHGLVEWFLANRGGSVKGFQNAVFSGFPTVVLADILRRVIIDHPTLRGLYNVSSEPISKYDLLSLIGREFAADVNIEPADEPRIDRSLDSTRFQAETGLIPKTWTEMVKEMRADSLDYDSWRK